MGRRFAQVDVFSSVALGGNPVAVVLDGDGLTVQEMQRFARWTNLSETTFVQTPSTHEAELRVRIFTPAMELPFAGHPTLGTCHAWLERATRGLRLGETIVQECGAGLIEVRRIDAGLAFAAPPLVRSGPVEESLVDHLATVLRIERAQVLDSQWVDNGPGWVAVLLDSAEAVLALRPEGIDLDVGVVGPLPPNSPEALELRAFFPVNGATIEDPVTGSLNASVAEWLSRTGRVELPYIARQGTAIGRAGRVHVERDIEGTIWVGGATSTRITGTVDL